MVDCMDDGSGGMVSPPRILVIGDPENMFASSLMEWLDQLESEGKLEFEFVLPVQLEGLKSEEMKAMTIAAYEEGIRERLKEYQALVCRPTMGGKVTGLMVREVQLPFYIATLSKGANHIVIPEDRLWKSESDDPADKVGKITIIKATDENAPAVAELTVHLANLLLRPLHRYAWLVNTGRFDTNTSRDSRRLEGLTWVSVGAGDQVSYLLERLLNWRLKRFIIQTRSMGPEKFRNIVRPVLNYLHGGDEEKVKGSLDQVDDSMSLDIPVAGEGKMTLTGVRDVDIALQEADVVSIHLRLVSETENFFNKERLAKMKRGAYLINVSRGGIVDEGDVLDALNNEHLAGYAADVIKEAAEESKKPSDSLLWQKAVLMHQVFSADASRDPSSTFNMRKHPNILLTPHAGGNTKDATEAVARSVIGRLLAELGVATA